MLLGKKNQFKDLGYMVDCSRGAVPKVETLKKLITILKDFGYTYIMLYTEDVYEIEGEPYFGYMRGRYSKKEIKEIDDFCIANNMELRACIQTLAHLGRIKRHEQYVDLFDINDIFIVKDEKVYEFVEKMISAVANMFTCKKIHIGMDEAWALGRGAFFDRNGAVAKEEIMMYHLKRVSEITKKYGFECDIWADMIMQSYYESKDKDKFELPIPENITPIVWRYWVKTPEASEEEILLYQKLTNNKMGYAGGTQKWSGFVPNNIYSMFTLKEQITSCKKLNVDRYLVTAWADGAADASLFCTLPSIYYASLLAHNLELNIVSKAYFKKIVGISFDKYLKIDNLNRLNISENDKSAGNLSFNYLYNDLFQGLYDEAVLDNVSEIIKKISKQMRKIALESIEFGYIFESLYDLSKVLQFKSELSINIYNHYKARDFDNLRKDVRKISKVLHHLNNFMNSYEYQWHLENKAFGYEKQNIRLGGLYERLYYVKNKLTQFINKDIEFIDELEETRLPISSRWWDHNNKVNNMHHNYSEVVSSGFLKEI